MNPCSVYKVQRNLTFAFHGIRLDSCGAKFISAGIDASSLSDIVVEKAPSQLLQICTSSRAP